MKRYYCTYSYIMAKFLFSLRHAGTFGEDYGLYIFHYLCHHRICTKWVRVGHCPKKQCCLEFVVPMLPTIGNWKERLDTEYFSLWVELWTQPGILWAGPAMISTWDCNGIHQNVCKLNQVHIYLLWQRATFFTFSCLYHILWGFIGIKGTTGIFEDFTFT